MKVSKENAEEARAWLRKSKIFDRKKVKSDSNSVFFPVKSKAKTPFKAEFIEGNTEKYKKTPKNLKDALKGKLSATEMSHLKTSFDVTGSIAILEIDDELKPKQKLIADTLLKLHPNLTTILKKAGIHSGEFRTQKMAWVAGKKTKVAEYKENGITLKLDVEQVYFSVRLSTERKRIRSLIQPGEKVLVMFSGCAPYPIVFSKNTEANEIVGVEINPIAHEYGLKNLKLNKVKNVKLINSDVRKVKLTGKFDRIAMPLPKTGEEFLPLALKLSHIGTIIHYYAFLPEINITKEGKRLTKEYNCKLVKTTKCGQHAPRVYRVCYDLEAR